MRTSDETIRELERLNAERTQGEWNFANSNSMRRLGANGYDGNIAHGIKDRGGVPDIQIRDEDGACIAAAVNALPNLLDDVEELRRLLRRASGELHVVGSYRDNAETAGLYITAKAQYDLAVEIDAALAEKEHS